MFSPTANTDFYHPLWSGNTRTLGDAHPEPEDLQQPIRIDVGGVAIISTPPIVTGSGWRELAGSIAEATADSTVFGIVIVFDVTASQFCSGIDDCVATIRRSLTVKPVMAHIDRAYGASLLAALACTPVFATLHSRLGLLSCDFPFVAEEHWRQLPPLSYYEKMLAADVANQRSGTSAQLAGCLIEKSIGGMVALRSGLIDCLSRGVPNTRANMIELLRSRAR